MTLSERFNSRSYIARPGVGGTLSFMPRSKPGDGPNNRIESSGSLDIFGRERRETWR